MKVLIGEISSYKAIVIARFLKINYPDLVIYTYDYHSITKNFHSKYSDFHYNLNARSGPDYVNELAGLCRENGIDVFIPVHSDNIGTILESKSLFGKALSYTGKFEDYHRLHNKNELQAFANQAGIDTPDTYSSYKVARVPFVLKPIDKSSAKGVRYFKTDEEKISFDGLHTDNVIFQEFIEGFGCGYSVFVKDGKIIVGYGHRRLAEYPVSGGSSVYRTSFLDSRMLDVAEKLFRIVPWSGFAMIEFKYTPDNRLVLIEVNPRIWGSVNQGLQCGVNYFEPIFGKVEKELHCQDLNTYLSPQVYVSFLNYLIRFNFKPLCDFFYNVRKNRSDLNLLRDPKGYLSVIARKLLK